MAKWIYHHPDLVREGIVKQGQPLPVAQAVAAPQPAPESSEIPAHMIKPERPKRECKKTKRERVSYPPRECVFCGKTFTPGIVNQITCSKECFYLRHNNLTNELRKKKIREKYGVQFCKICGAKLPEEWDPRRKFCSEECRKANGRQRYHARCRQKQEMEGETP